MTTERPAPPAGFTVAELPEVPTLRRMIGPGVIAVGIGMAAGEIILWPYITSIAGLGLLWLAVLTLAVQTLINLEIERYTLATGQTAVAGFSRWWKGWGLLLCLGGLAQYTWPGWATSASTVLTYAVGGGDVTTISVISLFVIGLVLTLSPVIYRTVEGVEFFKVAATIVFLAVAIIAVISVNSWGDASVAVVRDFGRIPEGVSFALMLSAMGAAGAGGVHNLVLSNWIRDKGYGMGAHVPRLTSPITGKEEPAGAAGFAFPQDEANLARWRLWWKRANAEHLVTFFAICLVTILVMSLIAYEVLYGRTPTDEATPDFLRIEADTLAGLVGPWFKALFYGVAVVSLYATALGLIDIIGRLISDVLRTNHLSGSAFWTEGRIYLAVVWVEVLLGSLILGLGFDQPVVLLLISTSAASVVTLVYAALLIKLNRGSLPEAIRMRGARLYLMIASVAFYAFFAIMTVRGELMDLLG